MGRIKVESEQTYINLTPSELTAYKALSFINADSYAVSSGSAIGDAVSFKETFSSNQGTLEFWYYPYNYGNAGQIRYLFYVDIDSSNRIYTYINGTDNALYLLVRGGGASRGSSITFALINPYSWNHIVCTWSKNTTVNGSNYLALYLNGVLGSTSTTAPLAMTSIPSSFYIGSNYLGTQSANGLIAYKISDYWTTSAQVTANYNSGNGNKNFFVVDSHTVAMGLTSESSTGVQLYHRGQAIQSISTVTLTMVNTVAGRWADGDKVVVWDDAATPNVVYTAINGTPSGSTIVVDDSCAAVTGTNKFISRNQIVDFNGELSSVTAWTTSGVTLTKNTTAPISGVRDIKEVNDAGAQGYIRQSATTVAGDNLYLRGETKFLGLPSESSQLINIDADASKGMTVRQNLFQGSDTLGAYLNCAGSYYASAAGNTIHQVTTEDICISAWVKMKLGASTSVITSKILSGSYGYTFDIIGNKLRILIRDAGLDTYIVSSDTLLDDKWHHVSAIIDKDTSANCKIFIDGIDKTTSRTGTITDVGNITNTQIFILGSSSSPFSYKLDGQICDFKLYIAAGAIWSDAQVLYQCQHPFDIGAGAGTITEAYALTKGSTTAIPARVTTPGNDLTLSNALAWQNDVKEVEFCFTSGDTSTDVDLCVPSVIAADYANYDNLILMTNLVDNPGCEGGANPPASWVQEANATVVSDTSPHAGTNCLKATAGAANVGASQAVTLVTGQRYTISGWVKATSGDSAQIVVDTGDTTLVTVGTVTGTVWERIRATFKATGTSGNIYLRGVANTDIVWFDDISIVRIDTGTVTATKTTLPVPTNQPALIR